MWKRILMIPIIIAATLVVRECLIERSTPRSPTEFDKLQSQVLELDHRLRGVEQAIQAIHAAEQQAQAARAEKHMEERAAMGLPPFGMMRQDSTLARPVPLRRTLPRDGRPDL